MERSWLVYGVAALLGLLVLGYLGLVTGVLAPYLAGYDPSDPGDYRHTTVTVVDGDTGEERGQVQAAIADSWVKRSVSLNPTDRKSVV